MIHVHVEVGKNIKNVVEEINSFTQIYEKELLESSSFLCLFIKKLVILSCKWYSVKWIIIRNSLQRERNKNNVWNRRF